MEMENTANPPNEANGTIRLDVPSLEKKTAHYPEELREPVMWLGAFVREECNRDLDLLVNIATPLGIGRDKTTWGKILRGMWNRDAKDRPMEHPVTNLGTLLRDINTIRKQTQLKELAGKVPFVMTSTSQAIFNFIDAKRAPDRVNKFGIIIGGTGLQKTATVTEYCRRNNHGAVVKLEAPPVPSITQFITDLATKYGGSRQGSWDRKMAMIMESLNHTRTIIVENVQRLFNEKKEKQPVFSYLQKIQDDTGCTIILTFTPEFEQQLSARVVAGYFEQFIGRAGGRGSFLRLPQHVPDEDVLMITKAFGMAEPKAHLDQLVKIAHQPGRIRILFEALQQAKVNATAAKERLTFDHVLEAYGEEV